MSVSHSQIAHHICGVCCQAFVRWSERRCHRVAGHCSPAELVLDVRYEDGESLEQKCDSRAARIALFARDDLSDPAIRASEHNVQTFDAVVSSSTFVHDGSSGQLLEKSH